jgi:hypothetical protein
MDAKKFFLACKKRDPPLVLHLGENSRNIEQVMGVNDRQDMNYSHGKYYQHTAVLSSEKSL